MIEDEALEIAERLASLNGWTWLAPVAIWKRRRLFGGAYWTIRTNSKSEGCNIHIEIDDATSEVIRSAFWPR